MNNTDFPSKYALNSPKAPLEFQYLIDEQTSLSKKMDKLASHTYSPDRAFTTIPRMYRWFGHHLYFIVLPYFIVGILLYPILSPIFCLLDNIFIVNWQRIDQKNRLKKLAKKKAAIDSKVSIAQKQMSKNHPSIESYTKKFESDANNMAKGEAILKNSKPAIESLSAEFLERILSKENLENNPTLSTLTDLTYIKINELSTLSISISKTLVKSPKRKHTIGNITSDIEQYAFAKALAERIKTKVLSMHPTDANGNRYTITIEYELPEYNTMEEAANDTLNIIKLTMMATHDNSQIAIS